jgi:hypothetical protein
LTETQQHLIMFVAESSVSCCCRAGTKLQAESAEPSDDAIKRTLDYLHDRAQGATYFVASDPGERDLQPDGGFCCMHS